MGLTYTLRECADFLGAELKGDPDCVIVGLNTLQDASAGDLTFLANKVYRKLLQSTTASAVIMEPHFAEQYKGNVLLLDNPYVGYARITSWFKNVLQSPQGVHPKALVAESAVVSPEASIGPYVIVGESVTIAAGVTIGAGTYIGDHCSIGKDTWISTNVSIYHGVCIGSNVTIHSSAVIGADGFGFANEQGRWIKIHQLGGVEIGDRVEIGACTTVDRGALNNTIVEEGVILDNHVQVAHNVRIGKNSALAAYAGISGSTTIGENCVFAAKSGAVGHITICDQVVATAQCGITRSIDKPGLYSSNLLVSEASQWRKNAVRFGQLDDMARRLKRLEKNQK